jgi:integrase
MKAKTTFPLPIKRGSVTVKIYRTESKSTESKKGYVSFQLADYSSGKRKVRTFADLDEARREAEFIATKAANGEAAILELTSADRAAYVRSKQVLEPTGAALEVAAAHYAEAFKILGGDHLLEAARYFAKRNPANFPAKAVSEVVEELLAAKQSGGASDRYLQDLRYRLGKLKDAFQSPISAVTGELLQAWFEAEELSPQSQLNFRRVLHLFFKFAIRRGYLPKEWDELERLEKVKVRRGDIEIFTPSELSKLLEAASPKFIPALAIGAFSGLRTAEIERLDWKEIHLAERFIEVTAGKAKTASRRIAPISDNLAAWLAPYAQESGKVFGGGKTVICDFQVEASQAAGVPWKKNALRHSFISYRLAIVQNAAQVALEAGNSAAMIFAHYRELVRPADAEKWFAIVPQAEIQAAA